MAHSPHPHDSTAERTTTSEESRGLQGLEPGDCLGHFAVREMLGQGSVGAVYRAWDSRDEREVALKVLRPSRLAQLTPSSREQWRGRFLREAGLAGRVRHEHIVPIWDYGVEQDVPYLAMPCLSGGSLRDLQSQSKLSLPRAVEIVQAIADALHHLHRSGLYHRDVKPSNILFDSAGAPQLSDFGIAVLDEELPAGPLFAGTIAYMSPEQARRETHLVDGCSDIFSLGVVLYELLSGRRPFDHPDPDKMLARIAQARVRPLRQITDAVPESLDRICLKALARRARDRYLSAGDLAADLRGFLDKLAGQPPGVACGQPAVPDETESPGWAVKGPLAFGLAESRWYPRLLPGIPDRSGVPEAINFWLRGVQPRDSTASARRTSPARCGSAMATACRPCCWCATSTTRRR